MRYFITLVCYGAHLHGEEPRWARHGSTRWLRKDRDVQEAIRYVVEGQGEPMEVHRSELA